MLLPKSILLAFALCFFHCQIPVNGSPVHATDRSISLSLNGRACGGQQGSCDFVPVIKGNNGKADLGRACGGQQGSC
ncbi:hypothetical protein B0H19DRAFT_1199822, partial [Mycena capillaripes]